MLYFRYQTKNFFKRNAIYTSMYTYIICVCVLKSYKGRKTAGGSLPRRLQWPGLGQTKARSRELLPTLLCSRGRDSFTWAIFHSFSRREVEPPWHEPALIWNDQHGRLRSNPPCHLCHFKNHLPLVFFFIMDRWLFFKAVVK